MSSQRRIAYVSLQAVVDGQDTWAAVTETIAGWEAAGWQVDRYFPEYRTADGAAPGALARLAEMYRVQKRLAARVAEYDAVYIRVHPLALAAARAARRAGVAVVQECNGPYDDLFIAWPATRFAAPLFIAMQRAQYRSADAIISVSDGLTKWLEAQGRIAPVTTIGNGANIAEFSPDTPVRAGLPERYAVFFGQFAKWQGIDVLLQAATSEAWPAELPLVLVGDGAMRPLVEAAAAAHPERIVYIGRILYAEVGQVVAHSAMSFVPLLAGEAEMMHSPLKLYESMACGVPVIASDVAGIAEVVTAEGCGLLVAPGDARSLAEAAAAVLADADSARAMGARGREAAVTRYSWPARARERLGVIERAIAAHRSA